MATDVRAASAKRIECRAAIASVIGTTIEWYDFFIYGTAAALIFPNLYFGAGGSEGLIESFSTIFVGFLSRPIGAALFGHIGDCVGRKATLVATLSLMGVATVLVGILPDRAAIGAWAGWGLVALRFFQGIGVGGEWGGAVLLSMESHQGDRRGFMASLPHIGVPLGLVVSVLAWSACSHWAGGNLESGAWRIPFIASGALLIFGLVVRLGVPETPDFVTAQREVRAAKPPLIEAIKTQWRSILLAALIRPGEQGSFYMLSTFVVLYGSKQLGLGRDFMLNVVLLGAVVSCFMVPFFGHLGDRLGRRRVYLAGAIAMTLFAVPYFWMLDTRQPVLVIAAILLLMTAHDMMYGPQAAYITESFPAHIRYTGASLGYQGASIIAGGPAPLISLWLFQTFGTGYAVGGFLAVLGLISTFGAFFLGREARTSPASHRCFNLSLSDPHRSSSCVPGAGTTPQQTTT